MTDDTMLPASAFREHIKSVEYKKLPLETGEYRIIPDNFNAFVEKITGLVDKKIKDKKLESVFNRFLYEEAVTTSLFFHNPHLTVYADPITGSGRVLDFAYRFMVIDTAVEIILNPNLPKAVSKAPAAVPSGWDKVDNSSEVADPLLYAAALAPGQLW